MVTSYKCKGRSNAVATNELGIGYALWAWVYAKITYYELHKLSSWVFYKLITYKCPFCLQTHFIFSNMTSRVCFKLPSLGWGCLAWYEATEGPLLNSTGMLWINKVSQEWMKILHCSDCYISLLHMALHSSSTQAFWIRAWPYMTSLVDNKMAKCIRNCKSLASNFVYIF